MALHKLDYFFFQASSGAGGAGRGGAAELTGCAAAGPALSVCLSVRARLCTFSAAQHSPSHIWRRRISVPVPTQWPNVRFARPPSADEAQDGDTRVRTPRRWHSLLFAPRRQSPLSIAISLCVPMVSCAITADRRSLRPPGPSRCPRGSPSACVARCARWEARSLHRGALCPRWPVRVACGPGDHTVTQSLSRVVVILW
jgi:hypothetical protein